MDSELQKEAVKLYKLHFNGSPNFCVVAPGRVNLIGEHTDYNEGFCCPLAVNLATCIVGIKNDSNLCTITSNATQVGNVTQFRGDSSLAPKKTVRWFHYVQGVVAQYLKEFDLPQIGFQIAIYSTVPLGGGLSSSASLEVAVASFIETIYNLPSDPLKRALLCQNAEHEFAHVPCGIMDQYISSCAQKDCALCIDCRTNKCELVPLSDPHVSLVICNSNCKHSLTGSEYPERVNACKKVASIIAEKHPEVKALRDCTIEMLDEVKEQISEVEYRRALHAITEDIRTHKCTKALIENDYVAAGEYLYESHDSLKQNFEVSTPELDLLVDIAKSVDGVFGSRMTGGGFGGCTITLVKEESVNTLVSALKNQYKEKTGNECTIFVTTPCQGAHVCPLPTLTVSKERKCPFYHLVQYLKNNLFGQTTLVVSAAAISIFIFQRYFTRK